MQKLNSAGRGLVCGLALVGAATGYNDPGALFGRGPTEEEVEDARSVISQTPSDISTLLGTTCHGLQYRDFIDEMNRQNIVFGGEDQSDEDVVPPEEAALHTILAECEEWGYGVTPQETKDHASQLGRAYLELAESQNTIYEYDRTRSFTRLESLGAAAFGAAVYGVLGWIIAKTRKYFKEAKEAYDEDTEKETV